MAQDFAHRNYSHTQGKIKNGGGGRPSKDRTRRAQAQHTLVSPAAVDSILAVADPRGAVLEPQPGDGLLTQALARRGAQVTAYEPDPLSAAKLSARTRGDHGIRVLRADLSKTRPPREPFAVVGNVPGAATRIIDWCLAAPALTSATLVVTSECAGANGHWDMAAVQHWPWFDRQPHGTIEPASFRPALTTDATIVHLHRRPQPLVNDQDSYTTLVRTGFTAPNSPLLTALRSHYPNADKALTASGIPWETTAPAVHPDDWIRLHEHLLR
ncbi:rRNA (adenine-N6)-methyltransferase [Nocardia brasiliensis]|uniref:rRNA (Adenine-N6)-methyltransferase n=1 Tax=Nocardia brasiliensis TaxID=37326 RepID=A0A6G9XVI5_NOCBR|nr:rRNA adenine N-6-methyltransferase family protein [Nocardia brasiliensis]QIS04906.1 rRNA (adenine-N6)-methyltransferase [Nocardia brasiliensis]